MLSKYIDLSAATAIEHAAHTATLATIHTHASHPKHTQNTYIASVRYRHILLRVISNTRMSRDCARRATILDPHHVILMTPQDWRPDIAAIRQRQAALLHPRPAAPITATGLFVCRKCGSHNTTYYQLQTRRADEGMTSFISCVDCGTRWKE